MTTAILEAEDIQLDHPLKASFLKWQCHVRQLMMRDRQGRPDDAIAPQLFLQGADTPMMGHVITVMCKRPEYSVTSELRHLDLKTHDPAHKRSQGLNFFSATYYQKHREFSDVLTATFQPGSKGALSIMNAERVTLVFEAYRQRFRLACDVHDLPPDNQLYLATIAQNRLFNQDLSPNTIVLGFEPDWDFSASERY
ncbi:MAG: hypothetical protein GY945_08795 [Rhodobacteraceae bacterium]|nr:hypothetical protein [Paracoccaceae bacterium]